MTASRSAARVVDQARRSDAWLALGTVAAAAVAFSVLVVLPSSLEDFAVPGGVDVVWSVGGPLSLVLAPTAAGLAAVASLLSLGLRADLDDTTRRLHLVVVVAVLSFVAFLASPPGQSTLSWWQD